MVVFSGNGIHTGWISRIRRWGRWYLPREQSSWCQHGAHLGPVGPRWAPRWPHEPCSQGVRNGKVVRPKHQFQLSNFAQNTAMVLPCSLFRPLSPTAPQKSVPIPILQPLSVPRPPLPPQESPRPPPKNPASVASCIVAMSCAVLCCNRSCYRSWLNKLNIFLFVKSQIKRAH